MNKIINWVFGSFFRTLGRIFVYILLGLVLSYLLKDVKIPKINVSTLLFMDVHAESVNVRQTADGYVLINDNSNEYQTYIINPNANATLRVKIATALSESDIYSYMFMDVCSTRDIQAVRTSSPGQSCTNSCWSNQVYTEKTDYICTTNAQNGNIYRITTPIQKWEKDFNDEMAYVNDQLTINNKTSDIISTTIYGVYVSNDTNNGSINIDYTNIINDIGNRQITAIDASTSAINNVAEEARENTQDIIDNQNSNTDKEIESQKVCNDLILSYTSADKDKLESYYLNDSGNLVSGSNVWYVTNYIKIQKDEIYKLNYSYSPGTSNYCLYDNNYNLINCVRPGQNGIFTIQPSQNGYIRFSMNLNEGNKTNFSGKICQNGNQAIGDSLNETNDFLTDDTPPDTDISSLGTVQGLLPPGPVDSLLNIPVSFLSVITSSMSGTCSPLQGDFVYGSTLSIPCFSEMIYDNNSIPPVLMLFINVIPSAFILIQYFKHLYKKVDRAVSMDATADDDWGVI